MDDAEYKIRRAIQEGEEFLRMDLKFWRLVQAKKRKE